MGVCIRWCFPYFSRSKVRGVWSSSSEGPMIKLVLLYSSGGMCRCYQILTLWSAFPSYSRDRRARAGMPLVGKAWCPDDNPTWLENACYPTRFRTSSAFSTPETSVCLLLILHLIDSTLFAESPGGTHVVNVLTSPVTGIVTHKHVGAAHGQMRLPIVHGTCR